MGKEGAQIFVKIDEYKEILELVNSIKGKMNEARETLNKLSEMRNDEDSELELWQTELDDIDKKIEQIDRQLFEPDAV